MIHDKNCPFCKESNAAEVFFASNQFRAIYNRAPILPGHTLIVPARHVTRFDDLNDQELATIMVFTKQVNKILQQVFPAEGFNWTIQDGSAAGQTIDHLHVHVIPRVREDFPDPGDWYPRLQNASDGNIDSEDRPRHTPEELIQITQKLKDAAAEIM